MTLLERRLRDSASLATQLRAQLNAAQKQLEYFQNLPRSQAQARLLSDTTQKLTVSPGRTAKSVSVNLGLPLQAAGISKNQRRKGWTGGRVGPSQAAHASRDLSASTPGQSIVSGYLDLPQVDTNPDATANLVNDEIHCQRPLASHSARATAVSPAGDAQKFGAGQQHADAAVVSLHSNQQDGTGTNVHSDTYACRMLQGAAAGPSRQWGGARGDKCVPASAPQLSASDVPVGKNLPGGCKDTMVTCLPQGTEQQVTNCNATAVARDGHPNEGWFGARSVGAVGVGVPAVFTCEVEPMATGVDTGTQSKHAKGRGGPADAGAFASSTVLLIHSQLQASVGEKRASALTTATFARPCKASCNGSAVGRCGQKVAGTEVNRTHPSADSMEALELLQGSKGPSVQSEELPQCKLDVAAPVLCSVVRPEQALAVAAQTHHLVSSKHPSKNAACPEPEVRVDLEDAQGFATAPSTTGHKVAQLQGQSSKQLHPNGQQAPSIGVCHNL